MDVISTKLNQLRRLHHRNQLLRGLGLLLLLAASAWLAFGVLEGFTWMPVAMRTAFVVLVLLACGYVLVRYVCIPGLQYAGVVHGVTNEELASMVGRHFPQVQDKLLNLLQLQQWGQSDSALVLAAIQSKTQTLQTLPFGVVIDYDRTLSLFRWLLIPAFSIAVLFLVLPEWMGDASYRLAHFSEPFFPPPPFTVTVRNHPATMVAGESATIDFSVSGKDKSATLYVFVQQGNEPARRYDVKKKGAEDYSFDFVSPTAGFGYSIGNELYRTPVYYTKVVQRPAIDNFYLSITPPAYTRLPAQTLATEVGDFEAPIGSRIQWHVKHKDVVQQTEVQDNKGAIKMELADDGMAAVGHTYLLHDLRYRFAMKNKQGFENNDSIFYLAKVIPDKAPTVTLLNQGTEYIVPVDGRIVMKINGLDDYGFTKLALQYRITQSDLGTVADSTKLLMVTAPLGTGNEFTHLYEGNVRDMGLQPGDVAECNFVAWDNDGVAGPKRGESATFRLVFATKEVAFNKLEESQSAATSTLDELVKQSKAISKEIERLKRELLDKKSISAEDKAQLQNLESLEKELAKKMDDARKQLEKSLETARQNQLLNKQTERKLQDIKELTKPPELQDPEMQEFLKQMRDRSNLMDKKLMNHQLQKLQQNNEMLRQNAERIQELFKQWKADQKLEKVLEQTRNLEARQELLQQNTERARNKENYENLKQKQEDLKADQQNLQQEMAKLQELKEQTRRPDKEVLDSLRSKLMSMDQAMDEAADQLSKQRKKEAAQKQQQIQKQLEQVAERLAQMQEDNEREQQAENYEDLRNLLENLLKLSFDQEALRNSVQSIRANDPSVDRKCQEQSRLKDEMRLVEDSLNALSKRVVEIQEKVLEEVRQINGSMDNSLELLTSRNLGRAVTEQHLAMTSLNTLANMLTEALRSMQQSMKQRKGQQGGKNKPNPMQIGMPLLLPMQQGLNQSLEQLMQDGEKSSEQFQQAAQQQEQIRQRLQELYGNLKEQGRQGLTPLQKAMQEMEQSESELRKGALTKELLQRQQQILNRMLDYDKALREREMEERRESQTGKEDGQRTPVTDKVEDETERQLRDQLYRRRLQYNSFYQRLTDEYMDQLRKQGQPGKPQPK